MHDITISIATHNVGVHLEYAYTLSYYTPYLTDSTPEFIVQSSFNDIYCERKRTFLDIHQPILPDMFMESAVLLRKVADQFLNVNIILMHGAVVAIEDAAYMFVGKSGTGKTTHILQWLKNVPGAYVVNGDKPFIITGKTPKACGTPWCGKEGMGKNAIVPLKAIVFMERSENNNIYQISAKQAYPYLLEHAYRPDDIDKMKNTMQLLLSLTHSVSLYKFKFNNFKEDCFEVSYAALTGND